MLVNVPKLVTAYYTDAPDPSVPGQRVAFGASGHRGSAFKKAFNSAPIGGLKVIAGSGWFAALPSGTQEIYKIYAESFRGTDHLRGILEEAQAIVGAALAAPTQQPVIASRTNLKEKL